MRSVIWIVLLWSYQLTRKKKRNLISSEKEKKKKRKINHKLSFITFCSETKYTYLPSNCLKCLFSWQIIQNMSHLCNLEKEVQESIWFRKTFEKNILYFCWFYQMVFELWNFFLVPRFLLCLKFELGEFLS